MVKVEAILCWHLSAKIEWLFFEGGREQLLNWSTTLLCTFSIYSGIQGSCASPCGGSTGGFPLLCRTLILAQAGTCTDNPGITNDSISNKLFTDKSGCDHWSGLKPTKEFGPNTRILISICFDIVCGTLESLDVYLYVRY